MNLLKIYSAIIIAFSLFLITACNNDDPVIPNEEELINELSFMLVPASGGDTLTLLFQDLDGDGGMDPFFLEDSLAANTTYIGAVKVDHIAVTPSGDIMAEIIAEAEDHQFFYSSNLSGVGINYTDMDSNGNPIGITTEFITGEAGSGNLTITLRHEPDKLANGVSDGDITNAGGETDIEVTFNLTIQ